jgi:vitamin B12 transporter
MAAVSTAAAANAGEAGGPPGPAGSGDDEKTGDRIVVTASQLPTAPEKTGSSVSLFDAEEFETHRPLDTWEQLRFAPGLHFVRTGTRGATTSLFLRGGESDHTLVLLDGFKVNDDGGSFGWGALHPAGVGRVEVVRGAGTPLFGADAMTGAVQVITARGSGTPRGEASIEAGTYSTTREEARLVGEDGPVAYNLTLARFDMTDGRFRNSDYRATTFAGRVDLDVPAGIAAKLVIHSMDDEAGNYTRDDYPDPNSVVENRRELIGLELGRDFGERFRSRLRVGRTLRDYLFDDQIDSMDTSNYRTERLVERISVDWQNDLEVYRWGPAVGVLTVGVAWEEEKGRISAVGSGAVTSENHIRASRTARSLYAHKRLELWEALTVDGGVRVEDHSTYGTETSARLAAALWIDRTGTKLHGSVGQGIKNPTFNENFDASWYDIGFGATFTYGDPDLDPERVLAADVGVEQHLFDDRLVLGATLFRNEFEDFINFEFGLPNSTYVNAGKARAQGAEFDVLVKPVDWFRLRGAMTIMHSEAITDNSAPNFADGKPLIRRPERTYAISAEVDPFVPVERVPAWLRDVRVFAQVIYDSGAVDVDWDLYERVRLDSYTVVNAGVNWQVVKGLRLFARVDNIFNERYEQVVGISGGRSAFRGGVAVAFDF